MILDMIVWGFFSAWGWIGANAIKEKVWPEPPATVIVQPVEKQNESTQRRDEGSPKQNP
jgi:hypothetical protein